MLSRVEWLGSELLAKAARAAQEAIDVATEAAAEDAKKNHWWANRTGDLERNVIATPAKIEGPIVTGKFGSTLRQEGFYGLFLERHTPWLRPAADRNFPKLGYFIRKAVKWT